MSKLVLNDIPSGFFSNTAYNTNNALIETALENTLSRDGTGPNPMLANLDMNSYDILNVGSIFTDYLILAGSLVVPANITVVDIPFFYDIAGFISGKPTNSQVLLRLPMIRAVTFDVNLTLSSASAGTGASESTTFNIAKNGTDFGTMVFANGATTATFVAAVPPAFAIGDVLTVTAPASANSTLADIGFILAGQLV